VGNLYSGSGDLEVRAGPLLLGRSQRGLPVSSGVYFIKLTAKGVALDDKIIVLR
jgi:hypothetical protein